MCVMYSTYKDNVASFGEYENAYVQVEEYSQEIRTLNT